MVTQDDVYRGYHIPKGSVVVGNSWAVLHDKDAYAPDPDVFRPERFMSEDGTALNPDVRLPSAAFGYGRRICPGEDIARASIWYAMACILCCFDISKAKDENGDIIEPSGTYSSGVLSYVIQRLYPISLAQ